MGYLGSASQIDMICLVHNPDSMLSRQIVYDHGNYEHIKIISMAILFLDLIGCDCGPQTAILVTKTMFYSRSTSHTFPLHFDPVQVVFIFFLLITRILEK